MAAPYQSDVHKPNAPQIARFLTVPQGEKLGYQFGKSGVEGEGKRSKDVEGQGLLNDDSKIMTTLK